MSQVPITKYITAEAQPAKSNDDHSVSVTRFTGSRQNAVVLLWRYNFFFLTAALDELSHRYRYRISHLS